MSVTLYGIKNCDTMKKATAWLQNHAVAFNFHDYRKDGIDQNLIESFETELGWQTMVNKRGTTWRKLSDDVKEKINQTSAIALMVEQPALIKRPILQTETSLQIGFSNEIYQELFNL